MTRTGRPPKLPALRKGHDGREKQELVELPERRGPAPELPGEMLEETRGLWRTLWTSHIATVWDVKSDLPIVIRYFRMLDRWLRLDEVAKQEPTIQAVNGTRTNPANVELDRIEKQMRAIEDQIGLSPLARVRLGVSVVSAERKIEEAREIRRSRDGADPRSILAQ